MPETSFHAENLSGNQPQSTAQRGQISVHSENVGYKTQFKSQLTEHPVFPLLDRPKPIIEALEEYVPIIPRVKVMGALGLLGQRFKARGGPYGEERRIPKPYPYEKFTWGVGKNIARIPSVIARDITPGPEHTVSPQRRDITRKVMSGRISVQI